MTGYFDNHSRRAWAVLFYVYAYVTQYNLVAIYRRLIAYMYRPTCVWFWGLNLKLNTFLNN